MRFLSSLKSALFVLLASVSFIVSGQIQENDTLYFAATWKETVKDSAAYYRVPLVKEGDGYRMRDFYSDGTPQMSGISSSKDKEVWEGEVVWYDASGDVLQKGTYIKGKLNGPFTTYLNGKKLTAQYDNNYFISGARNLNSGSIYIYSEQQGDTLTEIIHDNNIKGIRYEQISTIKDGNIKTIYYGPGGKYIGTRKKLINGTAEGVDVNYYYKPMRLRTTRNAAGIAYTTGIVYYKNGQQRESFDDKILIKTYYDTLGKEIGKIRFTNYDGRYRPTEGSYLSFYDTYKDDGSQLQVERRYNDEKLTYEIFYSKNGTRRREVFYEKGDKVLQKSYDAQGKEIGQMTYENWLPQNGVEITKDKSVTYKDGLLIEEIEFYPESQLVFKKKKDNIATYYKRDGTILGTLIYKGGSYGTPLKGTQYIISPEGDITYIEEFKNGYKTKATSYRDRLLGDTLTKRFKYIEEYAPDSYNLIRKITFYSKGEKQSDVRYKGYDKVSGLFYNQEGKQIGTYDYTTEEGTLYEFFGDADEVKKIETRSQGKIINLKEYTYGPDRFAGAINPVLIQEIDVACCATFYSTQGDTIASANFKNKKPWEGSVYDTKSRERFTIKEGLRDGPYQRLDYNLNPQETGAYKANKKEGTFKKFSPRNVLLEEENYKNDRLDGMARYYSKGGELLSQMEYKEGVPQNGERLVRNYGSADYVETYKEGIRLKKEVLSSAGKRVITYKNGEEHQVTVYFKDTEQKRLTFSQSKGFVDGEVFTYTQDGKIAHKATFKKGKLLAGTVCITPRSQNRDILYAVLTQEEKKITVRLFNVKEENVFTATEYQHLGTNNVYINKMGIYNQSIYGNMLY